MSSGGHATSCPVQLLGPVKLGYLSCAAAGPRATRLATPTVDGHRASLGLMSGFISRMPYTAPWGLNEQVQHSFWTNGDSQG